MKSFDQQILKFLMVGLINTLFGYTVYAFFVFFGFPYLTALLISTFAGIIFNYYSFGRLVFNASGSFLVWMKFIITYIIVYGINAFLLSVLTDGGYLNAYFAQGVCLLPSVLISWLLMKFWVYKKGVII